MYGGSRKTHIKNGPRSHHISRWHPNKIAKSIMQIVSTLKTKSCDVSISSITTRNDQYQKRTIKVNKELKNLCLENNLYLIDHESTISNTRHVNGSKFHLNKKGYTPVTVPITQFL